MAGFITLGDAKAHLRVLEDNEDALIQSLIDAASREIENITGFVCEAREQEQFAFDRLRGELRLPLRPIDDETISITYLDGQGDQQQFTDFRAFVRNGLTRVVPAPGHAWPATLVTGGAVTLYADVGFAEGAPEIPANLAHACRLLVGHFFTNREAAVTGTIATELPLAVTNLLAPDRPRQL